MNKNQNLKNFIRRIIKEEKFNLLYEGSIKIPQEISIKFGILYDLLKSDYDKLIDTLPKNSNQAPVIYKDFFKMKDIKGNPFNVSVRLYNDEEDEALARMNNQNNAVKINMAWFESYPLDKFEDICYHELIHSIDPLTKDENLYDRYLSGQTVNLDTNVSSPENYKKYKKLQFEYTAELSRLVDKIKRIVRNDENRINYIFWVIKAVKESSNAEELYHNTYDGIETMIKLKMFSNTNNYWYFVQDLFNTIKFWVDDPLVNKKFWGDLYKAIK